MSVRIPRMYDAYIWGIFSDDVFFVFLSMKMISHPISGRVSIQKERERK